MSPHEIKVQRLSPRGVLPTKAHPDDLGWDLYAAETKIISAGQITKIATQIALELPPGFGALIKDRSSMASHGLHTLAGVIDPGYRGEILVVIANLNNTNITIEQGQRFAQLLLLQHIPTTVVEINQLTGSQRATGGFGSSGK